MFGIALTRPSLTMQLTSHVNVFARVCGQNVDTSRNYCDNIEPYDKRQFSFCQKWHKLSQGSMATYWRYGGIYYMYFVGNL